MLLRCLLVVLFTLAVSAVATGAALPENLRDTGLFVAGSVTEVHEANLAFTPQYPLWSDGADKRRWLYLPPGTAIDASRPDAWAFPRGTRLWKEFSHAGRRIETRYIERGTDGRWRFASYVWNAQGTEALLAPVAGTTVAAAGAPGGRHDIPAEADCHACHDGAAVPVLGASALQLAAELRQWVARGLLRRLPPALLDTPPRIAAASSTERAALGYLHANCGHCHNDNGSHAPVRLVLAQSVASAEASTRQVLRSTVGVASRYRPPGVGGTHGATLLVEPGRADASVLALRLRSRQLQMQMPPLGTRQPDPEGLALIDHWINHDLLTRKEPAP